MRSALIRTHIMVSSFSMRIMKWKNTCKSCVQKNRSWCLCPAERGERPERASLLCVVPSICLQSSSVSAAALLPGENIFQNAVQAQCYIKWNRLWIKFFFFFFFCFARPQLSGSLCKRCSVTWSVLEGDEDSVEVSVQMMNWAESAS